MYLYRAVDSDGNTIDFFLSKTRDSKSAKRFLKTALAFLRVSTLRVITVDKNPAYPVAIEELKEERETFLKASPLSNRTCPTKA